MIIIRFRYRNHLNQETEHKAEFLSIHDLTNYFRWEPDKAMQLGYGPVDHERIAKSLTSHVRLYVVDSSGKEVPFQDVNGLAHYLQQHPDVAKSVQYKPVLH